LSCSPRDSTLRRRRTPRVGGGRRQAERPSPFGMGLLHQFLDRAHGDGASNPRTGLPQVTTARDARAGFVGNREPSALEHGQHGIGLRFGVTFGPARRLRVVPTARRICSGIVVVATELHHRSGGEPRGSRRPAGGGVAWRSRRALRARRDGAVARGALEPADGRSQVRHSPLQRTGASSPRRHLDERSGVSAPMPHRRRLPG